MPVSRSRTASFLRNRHISFRALVALEPLVSLMSRFGACSSRISGDRHTHRQTDRQTHRTTTVTLSAHARRGLISLKEKPCKCWTHPLSPGTQLAELCSGSVTQEPESGVRESISHPPCEQYQQHIDLIQQQRTSNKKWFFKTLQNQLFVIHILCSNHCLK